VKTYWGSGGIAPHIIDFGTRSDEWSGSCPSCFNPRERVPGTDWIGGWVGPRASLDVVAKSKFPVPAGN